LTTFPSLPLVTHTTGMTHLKVYSKVDVMINKELCVQVFPCRCTEFTESS